MRGDTGVGEACAVPSTVKEMATAPAMAINRRGLLTL